MLYLKIYEHYLEDNKFLHFTDFSVVWYHYAGINTVTRWRCTHHSRARWFVYHSAT